MMRSERLSVMLAYFEPCMPTRPTLSGFEAGIAPSPMSEVAIGILKRSERSSTRQEAPDEMVPPPTKSTGLRALPISAAAAFTCFALPRYVGLYDAMLT